MPRAPQPLAVPRDWIKPQLAALVKQAPDDPASAIAFSIRPGSSPDRSNSAIFSRISRRDRHMKLAISSTGSFSLMQWRGPKDPSATIFCRYSCRPGFRDPRSFAFPDFFVIQPNAGRILLAPYAD